MIRTCSFAALLCAYVVSLAPPVSAQLASGDQMQIGSGWKVYAFNTGQALHVPTGPVSLVYAPATGAAYLVAWKHPQRHGLDGVGDGAGACYQSAGLALPPHADLSIGDQGSAEDPLALDGMDDIRVYNPVTGLTQVFYFTGLTTCDTTDL